MSAVLRIYTDSAHTNEVTHTSNLTTTLNTTANVGVAQIAVVSAAGWPSSGYIDIDTGGNLETLEYVSITSNTTLNLASPTTLSHNSGVVITQWYYQLNIGDQTNGLLNDGTNFTPVAGNTATWYLYNIGDQTAQSLALTTSNAIPATYNGYTDTLISLTNATSGFASTVSLSSLAVGATQQFWLMAKIPVGQALGASPNPQVCVITMGFNSL